MTRRRSGPPRVPPRFSDALNHLHRKDANRFLAGGRARQIFERELLRLSGGKALPSDDFRHAVQQALKMALPDERKFRFPLRWRQAAFFFSARKSMLEWARNKPPPTFSFQLPSGAELVMSWHYAEKLADLPWTPYSKLWGDSEGYRVIVKPSSADFDQLAEGEKKQLGSIRLERDINTDVQNSIGYFGVYFFPNESRVPKFQRALICTWQSRVLPGLQPLTRKRFRGWDYGALQGIEIALKSLRIRQLMILQKSTHDASPLATKGPKLRRKGYFPATVNVNPGDKHLGVWVKNL